MGQSGREASESDAMNALALLEEALSILDQVEAPAEISAHVDLAICRLRERLGLPPERRIADEGSA